jgi:four helix bundle protein
MKNFRDLKVWQESHELTLSVYRHTANFPRDEKYGLTSQLRRSTASIPANIAEGCGRGSDADFKRFLQIAMGSASETEYHLLLTKDLGVLAPEIHEQLSSLTMETKRMLASLIKKLIADR